MLPITKRKEEESYDRTNGIRFIYLFNYGNQCSSVVCDYSYSMVRWKNSSWQQKVEFTNDFKCYQIRQTSSTEITVLDVCTADEFSHNTVYINVKYIPLAAMSLPVRQYLQVIIKLLGVTL